jgi:hypothetical protein
LHIVGFIAGALGASAVVVAVAIGARFSGWAALGLGAATFALAQVLYVIWVAGMVRAEARRRQAATGKPDSVPVKPNHTAAQKS